MSRASRIAIIGCWLIVAFLLARMAYGGDPGGIIYVIQVTHPVVLAAGAVTIVGSLAAALMLARRVTPAGLWLSIAVGGLATPLALVLVTQDHGSAPVVAAAAVIAMTLSAVAVLRRDLPTSPPGA